MKLYWTMKNGQQIDIDEMSESHLRNTLKMLVRNTQAKTQVAKTRNYQTYFKPKYELPKSYAKYSNHVYNSKFK